MSLFLDVLSWALLLAGGATSIVAGIGLNRFPDVFSRMHAASMIDTLGAGCVILGLILQAGFGVIGLKLLLVFVLLAMTTTTAGHALAKSALASGLRPIDKDGNVIPVGGDLPGGASAKNEKAAESEVLSSER